MDVEKERLFWQNPIVEQTFTMPLRQSGRSIAGMPNAISLHTRGFGLRHTPRIRFPNILTIWDDTASYVIDSFSKRLLHR